MKKQGVMAVTQLKNLVNTMTQEKIDKYKSVAEGIRERFAKAYPLAVDMVNAGLVPENADDVSTSFFEVLQQCVKLELIAKALLLDLVKDKLSSRKEIMDAFFEVFSELSIDLSKLELTLRGVPKDAIEKTIESFKSHDINKIVSAVDELKDIAQKQTNSNIKPPAAQQYSASTPEEDKDAIINGLVADSDGTVSGSV